MLLDPFLLGKRVVRRIAASLSQAELASRLGVDRAYVSGLELVCLATNRKPALGTRRSQREMSWPILRMV